MRRIAQLVCVYLAFAVIAVAQEAAPDLALKDLRGRSARLSDYRGKVVLLNFWATWCPPCRAEVPDLVKWQREYSKDGLQVVGVTYPPTDTAAVRAFARRHKINYPVLLGAKETKELFDPGETLPFTVVIDQEGQVRERIEGILLPDEFEEKIRPLLRPGVKEDAPLRRDVPPLRGALPKDVQGGLKRQGRSQGNGSCRALVGTTRAGL